MASGQLKCTLLMPPLSGEGALRAIPSDAATKEVFVNLTKKGVQLSFPRDPDRSIWTWYSPDLQLTDSNMHHMMIELPPAGFQEEIRSLTEDEIKTFEPVATHAELEQARILSITLDDNYSPEVTGYGTPFHGANATVDAWINEGAQICGVSSLSEILQSTKFTLIILATENCIREFVKSFKTSKKPKTYGFGNM